MKKLYLYTVRVKMALKRLNSNTDKTADFLCPLNSTSIYPIMSCVTWPAFFMNYQLHVLPDIGHRPLLLPA